MLSGWLLCIEFVHETPRPAPWPTDQQSESTAGGGGSARECDSSIDPTSKPIRLSRANVRREAGDRSLLILVNLEHGQELGDHQEFPDFVGQVEEF
jgi:hypothetical protein